MRGLKRRSNRYYSVVTESHPAWVRGLKQQLPRIPCQQHSRTPRGCVDRNEDAPNHLFNYGYAVLRAIVARALVMSGLLPTFGIHHHNRYNAYCLADDIMEPYRPYVDKLVLDIVRDFGESCSLTTEVKTRLLSIPVLDVSIDGRTSPLMVAASTTTSSLAKCFSGESRRILYPLMK